MKEFDQNQVVEVRLTVDDDYWQEAYYNVGAGGHHSAVLMDAGITTVVQDIDIRAVRKLPEEWEQIDNITVVDPDGWRGSNDLNAAWQTPIDREEWERRMSQSTVRPGLPLQRPSKKEFILCNNEGIYGALAKRERELLNELEQIQEKMREFSDES